MDKMKYLKELKETGKLTDLLKELHLPTNEYRGFRRGCTISLSDKDLTVDTWDKDFSDSRDYEESVYVLNDFMLISGFYDTKHEKLQTLFDFMTEHFPETYKKDCIAYLNEMRNEEKAQVRAKYEKKEKACDEKYADIASKLERK